MKILTAAEMREVDRLTAERGIPGLILMENAGNRVVDVLLELFSPLRSHHLLVVCGKGNNGGDGFVIARQFFSRRLCRQLTVVELFAPETLAGDALQNRNMLAALGCPVLREIPMLPASIVVDAILGSGLKGPASDPALAAIHTVNTRFASAHVVSVDIPSGLPSDGQEPEGDYIRAHHTVTFTAAKHTYQHLGKLHIRAIGNPDEFVKTNPINLTTPDDLRRLFQLRPRDSNKGLYGHALVIGGSYGKSGAPAMTGIAALKSGAGLVTVAVPPEALQVVASYRPELMTDPLDFNTPPADLTGKMNVVAIGPGLGAPEGGLCFVKTLYVEENNPVVVDADALNLLAADLPPAGGKIRILTPHPGEMSRLTGQSTREIQADRLNIARRFAAQSGAVLVLKGDRTVIAFPDGETWINPTGSPAMSTGGTGDVLTGLIAGTIAQHRSEWKLAVVAAVWLHGRCGELAAAHLGEQCALATDLLTYLPDAMNELRPL